MGREESANRRMILQTLSQFEAQNVAQPRLAPDWAISRDFNCSTRIAVNSVAKVLTAQPPSG